MGRVNRVSGTNRLAVRGQRGLGGYWQKGPRTSQKEKKRLRERRLREERREKKEKRKKEKEKKKKEKLFKK